MKTHEQIIKRIRDIEEILKRATPTYANKLHLKLEELYWVLSEEMEQEIVI